MTTNSLNVPSFELIHSLSFCVFDLETTGGNHLHDKIIEIGLVKIKGLKIVDQKSYLINPEMPIPDFIQKLTSIKDADVASAPKIDDVISDILDFMSDSILVAHNTSFDVPFFNSVLKRLNKEELSNNSICTNLMTKYMIPNLLTSNLNYMSKIFNLNHQKAHRALDDANATAELLLKYLAIFIDKKISKVNNLYYPKNKFELDRLNFKKDEPQDDIIAKISSLNIPYVVIFKGEEGRVLYSFASHGSEAENQYIVSKIKSISFTILTLKLVGPYFQALIELSSFFPKIPQEQQQEMLTKLCEFNQIDLHKVSDRSQLPMPADFIVLNHLIPEQYVIYLLGSLHQKMELVFRYPTHQNKLIQYINSKSSRLAQGKMKKDHLHVNINNFLVEYLKKNNDFLLINRQNAKVTNQEIKNPIESFMKNNQNDYRFPTIYL